jgi:polar amino acid transport system ATP-binding protein
MNQPSIRQQLGIPTDTLVYARGITKTFGAIETLLGVDLDIRAGTVTCIIGPSGSGKSTLLRCINHLENPSAGTVIVDGQFLAYDLRDGRLHEVSQRVLSQRRAGIGMVFQSFNLFSHMTVMENLIEAPISVRGIPAGQARSEAITLLERVGLSDKAATYPRELSGGQQQRVAIIRALAMKPKLLLFDEPTSALDPHLVNEVLQVMRDLATSGTTMVVVTHEIEFARELADQLIFLEGGRVAERGRPSDLLERPQSLGLQQFLASTQTRPPATL